MTKFTLTKRGNPCEICQNTSGKCRTVPTDFKFGDETITVTMHLCMEYPDYCDVSDFKYLGTTQNGYWGKYVLLQDLPEKEEQTEEQRQRWRKEQEDRKLQRLEVERDRRAQLLSEAERDREIRKLLPQLGLNQANRRDLLRRGLSDEQIKLGQFHSVQRWQACLVAFLWQRFGDSSTINLTSPHQVEVKVEEPIQPIPLSLVLD